MTNYSDNLRDQSKEMREYVKTMLGRLTARPSFLKEQLTQLSLVEGVPEQVKQSLQSLADEFGRDSQLYVDLTTAITGCVTANVYDALADQAEYLSAKGSLKSANGKLQDLRSFNSKLRILAANGDWEGFDVHIKDYVKGQEEAEIISETI